MLHQSKKPYITKMSCSLPLTHLQPVNTLQVPSCMFNTHCSHGGNMDELTLSHSDGWWDGEAESWQIGDKVETPCVINQKQLDELLKILSFFFLVKFMWTAAEIYTINLNQSISQSRIINHMCITHAMNAINSSVSTRVAWRSGTSLTDITDIGFYSSVKSQWKLSINSLLHWSNSHYSKEGGWLTVKVPVQTLISEKQLLAFGTFYNVL